MKPLGYIQGPSPSRRDRKGISRLREQHVERHESKSDQALTIDGPSAVCSGLAPWEEGPRDGAKTGKQGRMGGQHTPLPQFPLCSLPTYPSQPDTHQPPNLPVVHSISLTPLVMGSPVWHSEPRGLGAAMAWGWQEPPFSICLFSKSSHILACVTVDCSFSDPLALNSKGEKKYNALCGFQ